MIQDAIIGRLETYYQQYVNCKSDVTFNKNTNSLLLNLRSIPIVNDIITKVISDYPFSNDVFDKIGNDYYPAVYKGLYNQSDREYVSFCLQYLYYLQQKCSFGRPYFKRTIWIRSSIGGNEPLTADLFKTDFIRPIINFIINSLSDEYCVYSMIIRYRQRVETFCDYEEDYDEKKWQKHLSLYLFDCGIPYYKEVSLGNGNPDFVVDAWGTENSQYVIETKVFDIENKSAIKKGIIQLNSYKRRCNAKGFLVVFSKYQLDIQFDHGDNDIIVIDISGKSPSKMKQSDVIILD